MPTQTTRPLRNVGGREINWNLFDIPDQEDAFALSVHCKYCENILPWSLVPSLAAIVGFDNEGLLLGSCKPEMPGNGWSFLQRTVQGQYSTRSSSCCLKSDMSVGKIQVSGKNLYSWNTSWWDIPPLWAPTFGNCFRIRSKLRPCHEVMAYIHLDSATAHQGPVPSCFCE